MRIAMVSEHASPLAVLGGVDAGGQNVYVAALACACARAGHTVQVFTRRDDASLPRRVALARGVEIVHVDAGPPRPISKDDIYPHVGEFAAELLGEWAVNPPDVVHAHFWMSGLAAHMAGNATGLPVALTFHALGRTKRQWQGDDDTSPVARIAEEEFLARHCDRIIATARHETFELRVMGASRSRVAVVPCGVDVNRFTPEGPRDARPRRQPFRILCVGRLVARKGIDTVIQSLIALPDTELLVAGGPAAFALEDDPESLRLLQQARSLGVADRVTLLGHVAQTELPALYRSADVFVSVPWYEPFGMVAVEAMASGIPVVASNVGGLVDTVVDGTTGLHVSPRDPDALANALRSLLRDPARRAAMGTLGSRRARERYGWESVASRTLAIYRSMALDVARDRRFVG